MAALKVILVKSDKSCAQVDFATALASISAEGTRLLWMDLEGELSEEMASELARVLDWHPIVIENIRESESRPKLINFDQYSQISLHALNLGARRDESPTVEIDAVIAKNYLVTCHRKPVRSIDDLLADVEARAYAPSAPDELLYQFVSRLIEKYAPALEDKRDLISGLEEEALYSPGADLLERIVYVRDEIIDLGLALTPQLLILSQMGAGGCRHVRRYTRPYFRDAESRLRSLIDEQNSYKEILANSLELYRSAMSSRTNNAMKVLTAMSALFLPLTFVTGLFGMNVDLPLSHQHHAFLIIVALCLASFAGMTAYFKAKNWF